MERALHDAEGPEPLVVSPGYQDPVLGSTEALPQEREALRVSQDCVVCYRPARGTYCMAHETRKRRFGSPTAYACAATPKCCQEVFDNEETQRLASQFGRDLSGERYVCPLCRRTCDLEGCDKSLAGMYPLAKYCCTNHRTAAYVKKKQDAANLRRWGSIEPEPEPCLECGEMYTPHAKVRGRKSYHRPSCKQKAWERKRRETKGPRRRK